MGWTPTVGQRITITYNKMMILKIKLVGVGLLRQLDLSVTPPPLLIGQANGIGTEVTVRLSPASLILSKNHNNQQTQAITF
jgi:hypothetical protein